MSDYKTRAGDVGAEADAEIALDQSRINSLTEQRDAAMRDQAAAEDKLDAANTALATSNNQLQICRSRNARLRKQLEDLQQPALDMPVGSSLGWHNYDEFTALAGQPLAMTRTYDPDMRDHIDHSAMRDDPGRNISVHSQASNPNRIAQDLPILRSFLESVPGDHRLKYIKSHEPENPKKGYKPAEYIHQQIEVRKLILEINKGRQVPIEFWGNWMAWSVRAQATDRDMTQWVPPPGTWDGLAWDGYTDNANTVYPPTNVFADALVFSREYNLKFAIAECGATIHNPEVARIKWINDCQQMTADAQGGFWLYWDGSFAEFQIQTPEEARAVVTGP